MQKRRMLLWGQLVLGLFLAAAPWILDFSAIMSARTIDLFAGIVISFIALWLLFWEKLDEPIQ